MQAAHVNGLAGHLHLIGSGMPLYRQELTSGDLQCLSASSYFLPL